ncbi:MAG: PAS domain-containing protein [Candidatus Vogelbacteria bacterium]|nr:PAS domain-containing protein [Candidatus Vogelbacteria bacterium]
MHRVLTTTTGRPYYCVRKDKTRFPVTITVAPVVVDKKIIGAIEVFRDTTKEKEIDRSKSEFVSLASH